MLDFFRRHQKYFFVVITFVIVVSFSFFGTYSTLGSPQWREQLAFKAIDGREVTRADVDEMAIFLATDGTDKKAYGGAWGPNFLNDGVIQKDLFETGLAAQLAQAYREDLGTGLNQRFEKEKRSTLYNHPQARFINVQNVWNNFFPEMSAHYQALQKAQDATDLPALNSRIQLYLAQKHFTPAMLRQVLRYQEGQYQWLTPDPQLDRTDLSLFGYHTIEDWFSPAFTRLASEFIINSAIIAEGQGYSVSKEEALADLIRNTQISYQENKNNPAIGVASPEEYFNEQLRIMNMDRSRAVKVWRQILLFRRYFQDAGQSALVDTLPFKQFGDYAHESVTAELYRLPASLRLGDEKSLQNYQIYLEAISSQRDSLGLPERILSVSEVERTFPELVQKKYTIEYTAANLKSLQARIGLKKLWDFEVEDKNWETLKNQFSELGTKQALSRQERFDALDELNSETRAQVDAFAKSAIVQENPEWVSELLAAAPIQKGTFGLRQEGGKTPFNGLDKKEQRGDLMKKLDGADLETVPASLQAYTANNRDYYRIKVIERDDVPALLTFEEAMEDGTLDKMRARLLEKAYIALRTQNPEDFQNDKKEWKTFKQVEDKVAAHYFKNVLDGLKKGDAESLSNDRLASLRFVPYVEKVKGIITAHPEEGHAYIADEKQSRKQPSDQWLLNKETVTLTRRENTSGIDLNEAFALPIGEWSVVQTPVNGDLSFYRIIGRGEETGQKEVAIAEQTRQAQKLLSQEVQRTLMADVLQKIESKNAISLKYLQAPDESEGLNP
jgi:GcvH upstream region-like protein